MVRAMKTARKGKWRPMASVTTNSPHGSRTSSFEKIVITPPIRARGAKTSRKGITKNTLSLQSGLSMPVARVRNALKRCRTTKLNRISVQSAVYLTGVLEYLVAEILELSGNAAQTAKRKRIIPRHIRLAVGNDLELNDLCKNVVMPEGGVIGVLHPVLLPTAKRAALYKKIVAETAEGNDAENADADADAEPEL